jgi:hypothetical protein
MEVNNPAKRRLRHRGAPSTSSYVGVSWNRARSLWQAQFAGRHLGFFADEIEAARAYDRAAEPHLANHQLNFPRIGT